MQIHLRQVKHRKKHKIKKKSLEKVEVLKVFENYFDGITFFPLNFLEKIISLNLFRNTVRKGMLCRVGKQDKARPAMTVQFRFFFGKVEGADNEIL